MIRLSPSATGLAPRETFALDTLLDVSRMLRVSDPNADVVELAVVDDGRSVDLDQLARGDWRPEIGDASMRIPISLLRLLGSLAGAVDEQRATTADRFGRVHPSANGLVGAGIERVPIVNLAARAMRDAGARAANRRLFRLLVPWPDGKRWAVAFTHDLDVVEWWPLFAALRLKELASAGEVGRCRRPQAPSCTSTGTSWIAFSVRL